MSENSKELCVIVASTVKFQMDEDLSLKIKEDPGMPTQSHCCPLKLA